MIATNPDISNSYKQAYEKAALHSPRITSPRNKEVVTTSAKSPRYFSPMQQFVIQQQHQPLTPRSSKSPRTQQQQHVPYSRSLNSTPAVAKASFDMLHMYDNDNHVKATRPKSAGSASIRKRKKMQHLDLMVSAEHDALVQQIEQDIRKSEMEYQQQQQQAYLNDLDKNKFEEFVAMLAQYGDDNDEMQRILRQAKKQAKEKKLLQQYQTSMQPHASQMDDKLFDKLDSSVSQHSQQQGSTSLHK